MDILFVADGTLSHSIHFTHMLFQLFSIKSLPVNVDQFALGPSVPKQNNCFMERFGEKYRMSIMWIVEKYFFNHIFKP